MAEKLTVISDMWGVKKGLWISSYLGYLQPFFDITYYDIQQLANIDVMVNSEKNLHDAFVEGGVDTAVAHLLKKEKEPSHYLAFSMGGCIAWKAGLKGLPMKSLYTVSSTRLRLETEKTDVPTTLVYGEMDVNRPSEDWSSQLGLHREDIKKFGHGLYSDDKIIKKVCLDLFESVNKKPNLTKKAV